MSSNLPTFRNRSRLWLLALALAAVPVQAARTVPDLAIHRASAYATEGSWLVRLEGALPASDLVRFPYPLQVVLRETTTGTGYLRFAIADGAFSGTDPALADGLDAADAVALLTAGTPEPDARVAALGSGTVDLIVPASFGPGPVELQMYAPLDGAGGATVVLSNAVAFELEDQG